MSTPCDLIADIGGTHARFALVRDGRICEVEVLSAADHAGIAATAHDYLARHNATIKRAALSIAATLSAQDNDITLVNQSAWNTTRSALKSALGVDTLIAVNDFEALAHGIAAIGAGGSVQICGTTPAHHAPIGVIGPGTGLGMAGIVFIDGVAHVIASEGGNATLPATSAREYAIIDMLRQIKGDNHVSAEDAVSGTGLPMVYQAIAQLDQLSLLPKTAPEIAQAAIDGSSDVAREALDLFCHWLGVMAGNLALTLNATGGIYIAGGIIPQWLDHFTQSRFAESFARKGAYGDFVAAIPVYVVTHPYPALEGMRALLMRSR